ncbi:MAG: leucine-rich repeat domain-containing protein [Thermogutta sp.]
MKPERKLLLPLNCGRPLLALLVAATLPALVSFSGCRPGESPSRTQPPTPSTQGSKSKTQPSTGGAAAKESPTPQQAKPSAPSPDLRATSRGLSEFELVQQIIHGTPTDGDAVPAEFAAIIRQLLAAQAGLEFDLEGRLTGVDLAGDRRSGGDQEISLAVQLPHLKRLRIAGFGVTADGVKHLANAKNLEELALENTQIDDAGLESLKSLPRLWSLNLRRSVKLTDRAVETLADFPQLTHLYLLENQFSAAALAKLAEIPRLRLLDLRSCSAVNAALIERLSGMERLAAIRLRGYNVDDDCLRAVGRFSNLTSFTLEESPASNTGLAALARLRLESLTLFRCNAINDAGLRIVAKWKTLRSLVLRDMAVRGEFFVEVATLPQLRTLSAIQTMVGDEALEPLAACEQLKELALGQTLITDRGLEVIGRMINLRRLDLSQTSVTDQGLSRLVNLKELEWLDISGNLGISDELIGILLGLPKLKEIYLDGTSVTEDGIARLGPRARTALLPREE